MNRRGDLVDEDVDVDLPGKEALGDEAEDDIGAFAMEVVSPFSSRSILEPLRNSEAVEEDEDADVDAIDEFRDAASCSD